MKPQKHPFNYFSRRQPKIKGVSEWSGIITSDLDTTGHVEVATDEENWTAMCENAGITKPGKLPKNAVAVFIVADCRSNPEEIRVRQIRTTFLMDIQNKKFVDETVPYLDIFYDTEKSENSTGSSAGQSWKIILLKGPCAMVTANNIAANQSVHHNKNFIYQ